MDYPEWTKTQRMLLVLSNKLKEAYDRGQSQLMLFVRRGARNAGLSIAQPEFDLTEAVPDLRSGGEAVALFDRLWRGLPTRTSLGCRRWRGSTCACSGRYHFALDESVAGGGLRPLQNPSELGDYELPPVESSELPP